MNFKQSEKLLKAMSNAKRLEILNNLSHHEMSVGALQQKLGLSQSALSQHLAVLRQAGIVQTKRKKQQIFYRTTNPVTLQILRILSKD